MFIANVINKLLQESKELKDCFGALRHHEINCQGLIDTIQLLDRTITELKNHPHTIEEINGRK